MSQEKALESVHKQMHHLCSNKRRCSCQKNDAIAVMISNYPRNIVEDYYRPSIKPVQSQWSTFSGLLAKDEIVWLGRPSTSIINIGSDGSGAIKIHLGGKH